MASSFLSSLGDVPFTHFICTGFPLAGYKHFPSKHRCVCFPNGAIAGNFQRSHLPGIDLFNRRAFSLQASGNSSRGPTALSEVRSSLPDVERNRFSTQENSVLLTYPHMCFQPTLWIILSEVSKAVTLAGFPLPYSGLLQQEKNPVVFLTCIMNKIYSDFILDSKWGGGRCFFLYCACKHLVSAVLVYKLQLERLQEK